MPRPTLPATPAHVPMTVATSPGWHPYLHRLEAGTAVRQLSRPGVGLGLGATPAEWVSSLPADTRLVHVASTGPMGDLATVEAFAAASRRRSLPVVLTLFDLHDRDRPDPARDHERLDVLVDVASELTTLTEAAADRAASRWGRRPTVIGHGHVAPMAVIERAATGQRRGSHRADEDRRVVGVALSRTARSAPWEAATAVLEVLAVRPDVVVDLLVTDERVVGELAEHPAMAHHRVRVVRHPRLDRARLFAWLATVDVLLLPLRHATHSGWQSLCDDLAVALVSVGDEAMVELGVTTSYSAGPLGMVDADEMAGALLAALGTVVTTPDVRTRRTALERICSDQRAVYGRALASVG